MNFDIYKCLYFCLVYTRLNININNPIYNIITNNNYHKGGYESDIY
uniref:Uncharacterized protein n=1 Tax=Siphoviridae sp. cteZR38 TaxID=2827906 RepID=A0A8S5SN18_9CAUD|nr:MAG TPA: hypothetical protein [Siphoviridae sp. cteZR38]